MFLHNHWEYMRVHRQGTPFVSSSQTSTECLRSDIEPINRGTYTSHVYLWTGQRNAYGAISASNYQSVITNLIRPYIYNEMKVGTGTTPVDINDYKLEADCTSSFTTITFAQTVQSVSGHMQLLVTWSGTNSSNNDITITEIGLAKDLYLSASQWYNYSSLLTSPNPFRTLMVRHILTEPVTIEAGNTGSVILTIDLE